MNRKDGFFYRVFFTQTEKAEPLLWNLKKYLPRERGKAFIPMLEIYRRDRREVSKKPLFPGYVFMISDMKRGELHEIMRSGRFDLQVFVRELGIEEKRGGLGADVWSDVSQDLSPHETSFFDHMLDDEGVLRMSKGYHLEDKLVIANGPLKGFEDEIVKVDRHNRRAFLRFRFFDRVVQAGIEIVPRRSLFPDDKTAPEVLADGTEVDLCKLKKKMAGS